jgi:D-alanyl-D-alanine carboxypeptidase
MNYHAKELGLNSTRFANQHGLPNQDSKSTPIDVARLCF